MSKVSGLDLSVRMQNHETKLHGTKCLEIWNTEIYRFSNSFPCASPGGAKYHAEQ